MRIRTRPYRWTDHFTGEQTPGIRIQNDKVFVWVPMEDVHKIADQLVDIAERHENANRTVHRPTAVSAQFERLADQ